MALQVTFGSRKASRVTKPEAGHLAKAGVEAGEIIQEFRVTADTAAANTQPVLRLPRGEVFAVGQKVDVQGTSIGKGYAGTIKRHNFSSQRVARQQPFAQRARLHRHGAGSGRVFPGKRMTGHMGDETVTTQNLDVIRIDEARQLLLIKGAVPGSKGGFVTVRPAVKAKAADQKGSEVMQAPELLNDQGQAASEVRRARDRVWP